MWDSLLGSDASTNLNRSCQFESGDFVSLRRRTPRSVEPRNIPDPVAVSRLRETARAVCPESIERLRCFALGLGFPGEKQLAGWASSQLQLFRQDAGNTLPAGRRAKHANAIWIVAVGKTCGRRTRGSVVECGDGSRRRGRNHRFGCGIRFGVRMLRQISTARASSIAATSLLCVAALQDLSNHGTSRIPWSSRGCGRVHVLSVLSLSRGCAALLWVWGSPGRNIWPSGLRRNRNRSGKMPETLGKVLPAGRSARWGE